MQHNNGIYKVEFPNPDKNSELDRAYVENERFIPITKWLDYFNHQTYEKYWPLNKICLTLGIIRGE